MFGKPALQGSHISGINIFGEEEIIEAKIQDGKIRFRSVQDKKKEAYLDINKITSAKILTRKEIEEKGKSVVGRALVGTLIAGPLGTIVGGMSGLGTKKKKKNVRYFIINYDEDKSIAIMEGRWSANFDKFNRELNKHISQRTLEL